MANDGKRPLPLRSGVNLPLPPPTDADDGISWVRMSLSEHVPATTSRELPVLPTDVWEDDDDDDDPAFGGITAAVPRIDDNADTSLPLGASLGPTGPDVRTRVGALAKMASPTPGDPRPALLGKRRDNLPPAKKAPGSRPPPSSRGGGADVKPVSGDRPAAAAVPGRSNVEKRLPLAAEASGPHRMPRVPATPQPGAIEAVSGRSVAGRYQILEQLGQGGMGKVYRVSHNQLGKVFALKVIGDNVTNTVEARELFFREARMASAVNHPNITSVVDFGEDRELGAFMVMEIVEGEPLAKMLHRETRIGVRVACELILQVADALHYVHAKGIVHCDIKTENIIVCEQASTKRRQMVVKLLDFGLARSLTTGNSPTLSGTPHYVSPERIRGAAASPSSDIYALGILFYEIVTGQVPWDGPVSSILQGHLERQPTPPSRLVPTGLDSALEKLILHALAKQPSDRHKDMAAFIYELRTVMDMLGFGRRRRGGPAKRVVIERSQNERDALVIRAFEQCRLPLALLSPQGVVQVANPAFGKFVMGAGADVEGLPIQATPLASAWNSFDNDLTRAFNGHPVRRVLEIEAPPEPAQRLLMWLDAAGDGYVLIGVQPIDLD